jgi:hypothetical protein
VGSSVYAPLDMSGFRHLVGGRLDDLSDDEIRIAIVRLTAEVDVSATPEEIAARIRRIAEAAERSRRLDES